MLDLDPELLHNIRSSTLLAPHIAQLATAPSHRTTPSGSTLGSRSRSPGDRSRSSSFSEDGGEGGGDGGAAEIAALARRILEITEDDIPDHDLGVNGHEDGGIPQSIKSTGSAMGGTGESLGDEEVLRKSVRDALRGQNSGSSAKE